LTPPFCTLDTGDTTILKAGSRVLGVRDEITETELEYLTVSSKIPFCLDEVHFWFLFSLSIFSIEPEIVCTLDCLTVFSLVPFCLTGITI
jgi:hypothetical protein